MVLSREDQQLYIAFGLIDYEGRHLVITTWKVLKCMAINSFLPPASIFPQLLFQAPNHMCFLRMVAICNLLSILLNRY